MEPYELTRQEYLGWAVEQPVRAGAHGEESPDVAPYEQLVVAAIRSGQGVPERVWRQSSLFEHEWQAQQAWEQDHDKAFTAIGPHMDDSRLAARGYRMRRQGEHPLSPAQVAQIEAAMDSFEQVLGPCADIWRKIGLTIIHTGGAPVFGHAPGDAVFTPEEMTISGGAGLSGPVLRTLS